MERFIKSDKPYLAARYSKKKIGIGIGGNGAVMFVTPRAGDDFDDEMIYTIELMRHANTMYEMLKLILSVYELDWDDTEKALTLLAKARGEK